MAPLAFSLSWRCRFSFPIVQNAAASSALGVSFARPVVLKWHKKILRAAATPWRLDVRNEASQEKDERNCTGFFAVT